MLSEIIALLQEKGIDVLGITETQLTDQINNEHLLIDGTSCIEEIEVEVNVKMQPKDMEDVLHMLKLHFQLS